MSSAFLAHDMTPIDPWLVEPPRTRSSRTMAAASAPSSAARPTRIRSKTSDDVIRPAIVIGPDNRAHGVSTLGRNGVNFDGSMRLDTTTPFVVTSFPGVRVSQSLPFYLGGGSERELASSRSLPGSAGASPAMFRRSHVLRETHESLPTPEAISKQLQRQQELHHYEQLQIAEKQLYKDRERSAKLSERLSNGTGWETGLRGHTMKLDGRIPWDMANGRAYRGKNASTLSLPEARHAHLLEPIDRPTPDQQHRYMNDLAQQIQEKNNASKSNQNTTDVVKPLSEIIKQHRNGAGAPILNPDTGSVMAGLPRDQSATTALDFNQLNRDHKRRMSQDRAEYRLELEREMASQAHLRDKTAAVQVGRDVLESAKHVAKVKHDPTVQPKVGDDGKIVSHVDKLTESVQPFYDGLGVNQRLPMRHTLIETSEHEEKLMKQKTAQQILNEAKREHDEVQRRLEAEEKALEQLHLQQYPFNKHSKPHERVKRDQPQTGPWWYDQQKSNAGKRMVHRKPQTNQDTNNDQPHFHLKSFNWNQQHPDPTAARAYHKSLDRLAKENHQRRQAEKRSQIQQEIQHLDNAVDVKLVRQHQQHTHGRHGLQSFNKEMITSHPEGPSRARADNVANFFRSSKQ